MCPDTTAAGGRPVGDKLLSLVFMYQLGSTAGLGGTGGRALGFSAVTDEMAV